ncbi:hypothetical protein GALMADRAFT_140548 [Galerina marginata CBS 339.88]|uniref:Uncharacterized protein n=1 Tax=Galerina marginata (strain CBS 339.88) TaxID=685588 RepID=A0A067SVU4_GALM3|nr:hypothetical protein GALMADRAFT_140548 [Galerina marginata CBS 339.88]
MDSDTPIEDRYQREPATGSSSSAELITDSKKQPQAEPPGPLQKPRVSQQPVPLPADVQLQQLKGLLDVILGNFGERYKNFDWCRALKNRRERLNFDVGLNTVLSYAFLPQGFEGEPSVVRKELLSSFEELEALRQQLVTQNESNSPETSAFRVEKTSSQFRRDKKASVPNNRPSEFTIPPPLELMHSAFRQFLYELEAGPLKIPSNNVTSNLPRALKVASNLVLYMHLLGDHNYTTVDGFLDCVKGIFPNDDNHVWLRNSDLNFTYFLKDFSHAFLQPFIMVQVNDSDDHIVAVQHCYEQYLSSPMARDACVTGAPVFIISLSGTLMMISGGFCPETTSNPMVERFAGVNLVCTAYHRNEHEAASIFYALKTALLDLTENQCLRNHINPKYPKIIPCTDIVGELVPHSLFLGSFRNDPWQLKKHMGSDEALVAKMKAAKTYLVKIVCLRAGDRYGKDVHQHLDDKGFAPRLLRWHKRVHDVLAMVFMEYLAPPKEGQAGWLTLHDFGICHPEQAQAEKGTIQTRLYEILEALKEKNFVHGDLRPNNVMIKINEDGSLVKHDGDFGEVILKLIDFDWSGVAGQVYYPFNRNTSIPWPGKSMVIEANDDYELMKTWIDLWPCCK